MGAILNFLTLVYFICGNGLTASVDCLERGYVKKVFYCFQLN